MCGFHTQARKIRYDPNDPIRDKSVPCRLDALHFLLLSKSPTLETAFEFKI